MKRKSKNTKKSNLPLTEKMLLEGLMPYLAHADELAKKITNEEFGEVLDGKIHD